MMSEPIILSIHYLKGLYMLDIVLQAHDDHQ
jgi:hypothetical protein